MSRLKTKSTRGWVVDCTYGSWQAAPSVVSNNCENWFGWNHPGVGSISTTLIGHGKAELDFGNCNAV